MNLVVEERAKDPLFKEGSKSKEKTTFEAHNYSFSVQKKSKDLFFYYSVMMDIVVAIVVLSQFPFYYYLWNWPQSWVDLCGKGRDPSKIMAYIGHFLKLLQIISLISVSSFHWPPFYFWPLFAFGQFLNFRVYQLLGEAGTYYGLRFGKTIPWVTEFPFGIISDPQYIGSIMSIVACITWVPYQYILLWVLGYVFMIHVESKEDPSTRAKPLN